MNNKQIALQYLEKGLSVIPLISPSMASKNLPAEEYIKKLQDTVGGMEGISETPTN